MEPSFYSSMLILCRSFSCLRESVFSIPGRNVAAYAQKIEVPLVLKEVGFGMDVETIRYAMSQGIKTVDISGREVGLASPILKIVEAVTEITSMTGDKAPVQTSCKPKTFVIMWKS